MRFAKGKSGNPGGRPKSVTAVRELARVHTVAAVNLLVEVMNDETVDARARVVAANAILDRGHGRPTQTIDVDSRLAMPTSVVIRTPLTSGRGRS